MGILVSDAYSTTAGALAFVPTQFSDIDQFMTQKPGDAYMKYTRQDRAISGYAASSMMKSGRGKPNQGLNTFSKYEKLSGRPVGAPYTPANNGAFGTSDLTYPNYFCGTTDGKTSPTDYDRYLSIWGYADPVANAAGTDTTYAMPFIYTYLRMNYYIEFFDPYVLA